MELQEVDLPTMMAVVTNCISLYLVIYSSIYLFVLGRGMELEEVDLPTMMAVVTNCQRILVFNF